MWSEEALNWELVHRALIDPLFALIIALKIFQNFVFKTWNTDIYILPGLSCRKG